MSIHNRTSRQADVRCVVALMPPLLRDHTNHDEGLELCRITPKGDAVIDGGLDLTTPLRRKASKQMAPILKRWHRT